MNECFHFSKVHDYVEKYKYSGQPRLRDCHQLSSLIFDPAFRTAFAKQILANTLTFMTVVGLKAGE